MLNDYEAFSDYESSRSSDGSGYSGQANAYLRGVHRPHELWLACMMNDIESEGANGVPRERDELATQRSGSLGGGRRGRGRNHTVRY